MKSERGECLEILKPTSLHCFLKTLCALEKGRGDPLQEAANEVLPIKLNADSIIVAIIAAVCPDVASFRPAVMELLELQSARGYEYKPTRRSTRVNCGSSPAFSHLLSHCVLLAS